MMERLTADDRLMLWPDQLWPQDIGALAMLDGDCLLDPDGRFRIDAVRQAIEARLHLVPRFRQLLYTPRRGLGGPLWTDAPVFDVADHVRVVPLTAPADEARFLLAAETVRRQRMERWRPLWQMWFFTGLPGRRIGMFVRMHHAIADGIAGVAAIGAFLDTVPDAPVGTVRRWTPAPWPSARALAADNLRRHVHGLTHVLSTLSRPMATVRRARAAWPAVRQLLTARRTPPDSLNRLVGPDRRVALVRGELEVVRQVAHRHGAKVNDVLLAITAAGLRGLFQSRGESVENRTVPVYVPVTLRPTAHRDQARGNRVGQIVVPLPLGTADPGRRLARIAADTAARKATSPVSLGTMFGSRLARRALLVFLDRHPVSVTTADIPGPPEPLYLAGAPLLTVYPLLPLVAKVSLGVGAMSYAGQFTIAVVADRDAVPDLATFTDRARAELSTLAATTQHTRS